MLIFQVQSRTEGESESSGGHFGVRNKPKKGAGGEGNEFLSLMADKLSAEMLSPFKPEGEREVSDFISTLTPGAQSAIRAASFAWGYENASRYVKNTMKLEEVKNADNSLEKSKAVVESVQSQASGEQHDVSKFSWGYYNEDMKETQAQSGKSETITEGAGQKQELLQQPISFAIPQSSHEAVAESVLSGTLSPSLIYCASSAQQAAITREQQEVEQKRSELARLVSEEDKKSPTGIARKSESERQQELLAEAAKIAEERKKGQIGQFEEAEMGLSQAIAALDQTKAAKGTAKRISAMLPDELSRYILSHERRLTKKRELRKQLSRWLSFCSAGRQALSLMPPSKLLKIVSISSLLKGK